MKEKLNMDRPALGELSRLRLHETDRPQPVIEFNQKLAKLPDTPPVNDLSKHPEAVDSLKRASRLE